MKKMLCLFMLISFFSAAQENKEYANSFELNYFYGSIAEHTPDISHLITGHPEGTILTWNRKSFGFENWESRYNYPDYGLSLIHQDMKSQYLGENFGFYAHMNFYFLTRYLMLRVGQGIAYNTNPYDQDDNYYNNAYGSHLLSSTYLMLNFKKENIFHGFGIQAGFSLVHYSNADFKSPNNSTNTMAFNVGLNYLLEHENLPEYQPKADEGSFSEPIKLNLALRSGVNSMGIIGTGRHPFLTIAAFADKRINRKSTIQAGAEVFFSKALEKYIEHDAIAYPQGETQGDEDARRVGVFVGHQLSFHKLSVLTQLGFYAYYPFPRYSKRIYNRVGLQYDFTKNIFGSVSLRSHTANAEAMEFSIGYRL